MLPLDSTVAYNEKHTTKKEKAQDEASGQGNSDRRYLAAYTDRWDALEASVPLSISIGEADGLSGVQGQSPAYPFYVYVIECNERGFYYVGMTRRLERRLATHSGGRGSSRFVKAHGFMFALVHYEGANSKAEARKRESDLTKQLILLLDPDHVAGAGLC